MNENFGECVADTVYNYYVCSLYATVGDADLLSSGTTYELATADIYFPYSNALIKMSKKVYMLYNIQNIYSSHDLYVCLFLRSVYVYMHV